jgi:hypothetical protein
MKINATINRTALYRKLSDLEYSKLAKRMDGPIKQLAADLMRILMTKSKTDSNDRRWYTGHTSRMWRLRQIKQSLYSVSNSVLSKDQKQLVVEMLNYGNGPKAGGYIRPKTSKYLFVPLSKRAMRKRPGEPIPKDWVIATKENFKTPKNPYKKAPKQTYGRNFDYALVKRVRPYKGSYFVADAYDDILNRLREILRSVL